MFFFIHYTFTAIIWIVSFTKLVLRTCNLNVKLGVTPKLHTLGRYSDISAEGLNFWKCQQKPLNTKHSSFEWIWIHCFLHEEPSLHKEQLCICSPTLGHFCKGISSLFWCVCEYCIHVGMILIQPKWEKIFHSLLKKKKNTIPHLITTNTQTHTQL